MGKKPLSPQALRALLALREAGSAGDWYVSRGVLPGGSLHVTTSMRDSDFLSEKQRDGSICSVTAERTYSEPTRAGSRTREISTRPIALAERCEAASGADRDIDGWITCALDPERQTVIDHEPGRFPRRAIYGPISTIMREIGGKDGAAYIAAPAYTASLDAAMTLVPEGWHEAIYGAGVMAGDGRCRALLQPPEYDGPEADGVAATPALALCAAALRARALPIPSTAAGEASEVES